MLEDYIKDPVSVVGGFFAGISQIVFGHPFDTIKTFIQSNKKIPSYSLGFLYRGYSYPLAMSLVFNSTVFGLYSNVDYYLENSFLSGGLSGLAVGSLITPFENMKILRQISLKAKGLDYLTRGIGITTLRESVAMGIYFYSYEYARDKLELTPFLAGSFSGLANWAISYPLDTIKSRIQSYQSNTIKEAIKKGGLYNGISITLFRAALVNGAIFQTYEITREVLKPLCDVQKHNIVDK